MLKEGVKGTQEIMVTEENTAKVMGSGALDVFAARPAGCSLFIDRRPHNSFRNALFSPEKDKKTARYNI